MEVCCKNKWDPGAHTEWTEESTQIQWTDHGFPSQWCTSITLGEAALYRILWRYCGFNVAFNIAATVPACRSSQSYSSISVGESPHSVTAFYVQGIFPNQGSNPGLPPCRQILYHLSHQGSPWILEWVAYPFSREGSSWPRNWTRVSCVAGGFYQLNYQGSPIEIPHLHPFICWWTSRLLPCPGYCK